MEHPRTDSIERFLRAAVLFGAAAAAAVRAGATTYYVGTNGSDSNPGSATAPFATIQRGVNSARAGDTVIVNDGTYGCPGGQDSMALTINSAGTSSAWITLQAAHPGAAILDGQLICHSYIALGGSSAYWVIKGFDIRNGRWGGIWSNSGGGKNILVQGNVIHNIGNRYETASTGIVGIYTDTGANNFRIDGNVFHHVGRTGVLTGTHDHSIYSHGGGMIITNNVFYALMNGWHIQTADGFQGTIAFNTFYGPDPVAGTVGQVMLWGADSNVFVRDNIFYASNSVGITTYGLSMSGGCSFDHNLVYSPGKSVSLIGSLPSACSQSGNRANVDPLLAAPSGYNFQLDSGSPAIDAGVAVSGVTSDCVGTTRPQGAGYDVGAYEFASGAAPAPAPAPVPVPAPVPSPPPALAPTGSGCVTGGASWQNIALGSQTGAFTAVFDATPAAGRLDGAIGLSNGAASAYTALAAIVRFNNTGTIDARNGGSYTAASAIPYSAGSTYHFRLAVSVPSRTYSAYVTPPGGVERLIGSNYVFRTEQAGVSALSGVGMYASAGNDTVCNAAFTPAVAAAAGPAISAVAVSNVTASGAAIGWTTSAPATSAVDYGLTSSYGQTTPTNATPTTAHSVALTGLSASTLYHYRVKSADSSGNLSTSPDATFKTAFTALAGCVTEAAKWQNVSFPSQLGTFTLQWDATPSGANMDGVMGVSNGAASAYTSLAAAVRFNALGKIDARGDGAYTAAASIPYAAGTKYHFRLVINVPARVYSAYVTPPGGAEQTIGANYSFRTEQMSVTALSSLGMMATIGGETVCAVGGQ